MTKLAIISDVHGNYEALKAVLADIKSREIKDIVCLGDTIGYGPQPVECLLAVMKKCKWSLLGNHEEGVLRKPFPETTKLAADAMLWTRSVIDSHKESKTMLAYLSSLERGYQEEQMMFVHGCPVDPTNGYIFPDAIDRDQSWVLDNFKAMEVDVCFQGHTHMPGVFDFIKDEADPKFSTDFFKPCSSKQSSINEYDFHFQRGKKTIVNVGSVGQPRDSNVNSCYLIVDMEVRADSRFKKLGKGSFKFVRVPYDIDRTAELIKAIPELNDRLGDRLFFGK